MANQAEAPSAVPTTTAARAQRAAGRARRSLTDVRFVGVLVLLIALFAFFSLTQDGFFTENNIDSMLTSVSILFVVSIGLTFVMLSAGIDLSIGSMLALCGILFGKLFVDADLPVVLAILVTLAGGAALGGLINGFLIGRVGLSFLVVTLGTFILFRGVTNLWSNAETSQVISPFLDSLAFDKFLGLPYPVWIMVGVFAVASYLLRSTYFGRDVYAVGGNPEAARLSGINVGRTIMIVYGISGLLAALGGVIQVARVGAASPLVGEAIVFDAAAAVLIGGTSFRGGIGGVGGTAVGVLFLGVLQNGLSVSGVESFWQQVVTGVILIVAVLLETLRNEERASSALGRLFGRRGRTTPASTPASG